ncbi:MAG: pilus assembly protein PilP [Magnetococcales bacterium]|nr:pilus assembly protein PilP [Magnetococcales bacterium]
MKVRPFFLLGTLLATTTVLAEQMVQQEVEQTTTAPVVHRTPTLLFHGRDPFQSPVAAIPDEAAPLERKAVRKKEFLESFQMDSLKLVAILFDVNTPDAAQTNGKAVAMVEDPEGIGHLVRVGSYLGVNEGKIIQIRAGEVLIEEPAPSVSDPTARHTMTLLLHKPEEPGQENEAKKPKN